MSDKSDRHWMLTCGAATLLIALVAWIELQRIENGELFLFQLPGESEPSNFELTDARQTAMDNKRPAVAALLAMGIVVCVAGATCVSNIQSWMKANRRLLLCLTVAVIADLCTTVLFFHQLGIDNELHPAIRLMGYGYGRTIGPIIGKGIQAFGVIFLAEQLKSHGRWLVIAVTIVYFAAAAYNLTQSWS